MRAPTAPLTPAAPEQEFKIQNMVGSCDVKFPIRLEGLASTHAMFCSVSGAQGRVALQRAGGCGTHAGRAGLQPGLDLLLLLLPPQACC